MTQYELSEKTGISTTQISAYENGKKSIGLQSLQKIAAATDTTMDEIYNGSVNMRPITKSMNDGELIVNCAVALFEKGVLSIFPVADYAGYPTRGICDTYSVGLSGYGGIVDNLLNKIKDFKDNINDYPNPEDFKKQLMAVAVNQINNAKQNESN